MTDPSAPAIDQAALDALVEMTGGDPAFLAELIDVFVDDSATQFAAMEQAISGGQAADLRRAAHSLKSNSANFGATRLAGLCQELESRAIQGDLTAAPGLLADIQSEYTRVHDALLATRSAGA